MKEDLFNLGFDLDEIAADINSDPSKDKKEGKEDEPVINLSEDLQEGTSDENEVDVEETTLTDDQEEDKTLQENEEEPDADDEESGSDAINPELAVYQILQNYGYAEELEEGKELNLEETFEAIGDKVFQESIVRNIQAC